MYKCKFCGKEFDKSHSLGGHVYHCKYGPYYNESMQNLANARKSIRFHHERMEQECPYCHKIFGNQGAFARHEKSCPLNPNATVSKTCTERIERERRRNERKTVDEFGNVTMLPVKKKPLTEEHKEKLRKAYWRWITEHHDVFVKYSSGQSNAAEHFKKVLRSNGIDFVEEYMPYWKEKGYRLDIAFPDEKIGIEINGTQHYEKDGTLNKNTLEKQKFFEDRGWKILQIYYTDALKEKPMCLNEILKLPIRDKQYIKEDFDIRKRIRDEKEEERNRKIIERNERKIEEENRRKEIIRDLIYNSGIDFSKRGWSTESLRYLSSKENLYTKHPHIFQDIRKFFPEFLKSENVFKRKGSTY